MKSEKARLQEIIKIINDCHLIKDFNPQNLCLAINKLGPTFIKLGQIMSTRDDLIPSEYIDALKSLRSNVTPMEFDVVQGILDREFDGKTSSIFKYIDKKPLGSASIAQVHKATLKNGKKVAIKVQRENIYEMMEMDVRLLKKAINILQIEKIFNSVFNFTDVLDEIFETAKEEMDFEKELEHMERFRSLNKDVKFLRVPDTYSEYTTKYVLVMEYIDGCNINDVKKLTSLGYDMEEIATKLASNYMKQAIDDGFFHADPHPDNIMVLDGKIVYLDFGMMGSLTKRDRDLLNDCILAIVQSDYKRVSDILLVLGKVNGEVDHMKLRNDIKMILTKNKTQDFENLDVKAFIKDMFMMLYSNHITLPDDISMLIRGIAIIQGVLMEICPSINLISILKMHVKTENVFSRDELMKLTKVGLKGSRDLVYVPSEFLSLLEGINTGELKFNIELNDSNLQIRKVEQLVHLVLITVLDASYIIGTSLIIMNSNGYLPFIFWLYFILGGICTAWLFYKLLKSKYLHK